jgi:cell division protein FtsL
MKSFYTRSLMDRELFRSVYLYLWLFIRVRMELTACASIYVMIFARAHQRERKQLIRRREQMNIRVNAKFTEL